MGREGVGSRTSARRRGFCEGEQALQRQFPERGVSSRPLVVWQDMRDGLTERGEEGTAGLGQRESLSGAAWCDDLRHG